MHKLSRNHCSFDRVMDTTLKTQCKPSSSVFPEVSPVHTHHLTEEFVLNRLHVFSDRAHLKTAQTAAGFLGVVIKNMTQSGHTGGE